MRQRLNVHKRIEVYGFNFNYKNFSNKTLLMLFEKSKKEMFNRMFIKMYQKFSGKRGFMIKIYLIATTLFFVILFIYLELTELKRWYEEIERQMFIDFSTIMNQRRFARKRAIKNILKVLLIGFIVLCGLSFLK